MDRDRLSVSGVAAPVLIVVIALDVSVALYEAAWGPGLGMLPWLMIASVAISLVLVRSVLQPWALHLASAALGIVLTLAATARFVFGDLPLAEGVEMTLLRLGAWSEAAGQGVPAQDPLPFSVVLALSLWLGFHFSTWLIYREGKVWWAVAAPAVALMLTTYYSPSVGTGYVVMYAFCALLLVVLVSVQSLTNDWRRARLPHDRTVGDDFMIDAGYIVAAVLVVAWLLPPAALEQRAARLWVRFEQPWREAQQRWNELFPTTGAAGRQSPHSAIFGDSLIMGGPVQLGSDRLYVVTGAPGARMQAAIYDLYDGRQWWAGFSSIALLEPDDLDGKPVYMARTKVGQAVRVLHDTRTLVAATMPRSFDLPIKSEHVVVDSPGANNQLDLYAATARTMLESGQWYRAVSAVSAATEDELRSAGQSYPRWVSEAYLGLPSGLPERIRDLALEAAGEAATPYDQATAIETYLRTLNYSTDISAPPRGRDAVDYFLFDSREGYCNYFASAMVVMVRSIGIPARVVAGYAPGTYDFESDAWVITASEAHSWAQLYFPRYGWVDFEPTPAQPVIARPKPLKPEPERTPAAPNSSPSRFENNLPEDLELDGSGPVSFASPEERSAWPFVAVVAALVLIGSVAGYWYLPRRSMGPAERAYSDLIAAARLLGVRPCESETPKEYAGRVGVLVPDASADLEAIVEGFCRVRYGVCGESSDLALELAVDESWQRVWRAIRQAAPRRLAGRLGV